MAVTGKAKPAGSRTATRVVRIGAGAGFWGDTVEGPRQLVLSGEIDYLVGDYLAEITMSLLARAKSRDPKSGYTPDFLHYVVKPLAREIAVRNIKVVVNAGGMNPLVCREAVLEELARQGVALNVAAVIGDDVMPLVDELRAERVAEMWSGAEMPANLASANAYLGAFPIAAALDAGADIVITGRCADSALVLGPLIHEFGWRADDYDLLAAGSAAGHVVECGPQATGGIFTDWELTARDWATIGFPIAECHADGTFIITKPTGSGGLVSWGTVAEQVTYETGDPQNYYLPDVICDFSQIELQETGANRVRVSNVRGKPPTSTYKVSATYHDGYRCIATLLVKGISAVAKARAVGAAILERARIIFEREQLGDFAETSIEVLGAEDTYGAHARRSDSREVVLKIGVRHPKKEAVEIFSREIAPASTGMGQGIAGVMGGRPAVQPVVRLFSFLVSKQRLQPACVSDAGTRAIKVEPGQTISATAPAELLVPDAVKSAAETISVPLVALAYGRSGDKGDVSNIAVIAREPRFLPIIERQLSADRVAGYLSHLAAGPVYRHAWPGLRAFNFVLHNALGGGGIASLRFDPQGKAHAQTLMDFPIEIPAAWADDGGLKVAGG